MLHIPWDWPEPILFKSQGQVAPAATWGAKVEQQGVVGEGLRGS